MNISAPIENNENAVFFFRLKKKEEKKPTITSK